MTHRPIPLSSRLIRQDIIQSALDHYEGLTHASHLTECERLLLMLRIAECRTMLIQLTPDEVDE